MIPNMNPNVVATISTIHINDDGDYVPGMHDYESKPVLAFTSGGIPLIIGDRGALQAPDEYITGPNFYPEDRARVIVQDRSAAYTV